MARRASAHDRLQQRRLIDRAVAQLRQGQLAPRPAGRAAAPALRPGGHLLFTIESLPDDSPQPLRLLAHGRFAHRADHVQAACAADALVLAEPELFVLRFEQGVGMDGWLGVARRTAG